MAKKRKLPQARAEVPKQPACSEPCNACPYRRKGMQGWLGASDPEGFMETTMADYPMPCHQTIDYEDPKWKEKWEAQSRNAIEGKAKLCAGALIFFANIGKVSRLRNRPRLPADEELVFSSPAEFEAYHNAARVKSWKF